VAETAMDEQDDLLIEVLESEDDEDAGAPAHIVI
jgi:hypothetical protein